MVLRPPGSPGASETAWTAYVFGGNDGSDRNDVLNITLNIPLPKPGQVNICRGSFLAWFDVPHIRFWLDDDDVYKTRFYLWY